MTDDLTREQLNRKVAEALGMMLVPNFTGNIAQALELVPNHASMKLVKMRARQMWRATIGNGNSLSDWHTTPAEAIVRAWLAWKARDV